MTQNQTDDQMWHAQVDRHVAAQLMARLVTLDAARDFGLPVMIQAQQLHNEAVKELTAEHPISLEALKARILQERRAGILTTHEAATRLEALARRALELFGEADPLTRQARGYALRYARYSGDPNWRTGYQDAIDTEERIHGEASRVASMKRNNLAVALAAWGNPREGLADSYRRSKKEWDWRLDEFGAENSFVYVAASNTVTAALRAQQLGHPIIDLDQLRKMAEHVFRQRLRLLGVDHDSYRFSHISFQAVRVEAGEPDALWALLEMAHSETHRQASSEDLDHLPMSLCRAFALAGNAEAALIFREKSRLALVEVYGPGTPITVAALAYLDDTIGKHSHVG